MTTQRPLPPPRRILLASYASDPDLTRGRLHAVSDSPTRTPFQRDRDRIIHSTAFRRLKHKTQVFVHHEGDHYRTRLTHTIEVAQVARSIARSLVLDEDLAEAVALAHDLGHPPFGHSGEDTLNDVMEPFGGFDHNAQSLKIVAALERRYAEYDGLNLSWETIEGIVKHNGPLTDSDGRPIPRYAARGLPAAIVDFDVLWPLRLDSHSSLEAQAAALADDIAYDAHDVDDGVHAGLFELDELRAVPLVARLLEDLDARHPGLDPQRRSAEIVRRILAMLIDDAIACTAQRLFDLNVRTVEDARDAGRTLVTFSLDMAAAERELKDFLFARMYRHPKVEAVRVKAKSILHDLFDRFMRDPDSLPPEWRPAEPLDRADHARRVCDYMAGMTDRYAVSAHRRLFDATPDLR